MSDIHKRDYGRELEKKKSRRTQKHRASQHRLTAKFKKELAGKKRQEQTAESRAAEQAEQSTELLTQEGATRFASGATTLLLHGKKNQIGNEQECSDNNPSIHPSNQATTAPDETVPWNAKKPADAWRQQAKETLPPLVAHWAQRMGVQPAGITVTAARTRFGSCSGKNRLSFSLYLMAYPEAAIEYVVVHELAHIRHHDHSPAFYREVEAYLPDWRARRALLRR